MKKAIKAVAVMAVAVALLLTLTACGDKLVGTWVADVKEGKVTLTLHEDHTYSVTLPSGKTKSKVDIWSESGNQVTLYEDGYSGVFVHDGDTLTGKVYGEVAVFKKQ